MKLLNPQIDVVFKLLFANPDCKEPLIALLNAVLKPDSPIVDIEILNPEIDKAAINDRGLILDILAKLLDKRIVNVEMQINQKPGWLKRLHVSLRRLA